MIDQMYENCRRFKQQIQRNVIQVPYHLEASGIQTVTWLDTDEPDQIILDIRSESDKQTAE